MKLMIVGPANVGKTALVRALSQKWHFVSGKRPSEDNEKNISTDGIDIGTYEYDASLVEDKKNKVSIFKPKNKKKANITVSVWDFAGQEVYVQIRCVSLICFSC